MSRIGNIQKYLNERGLDAIVIPPQTGDAEYVLGNDSLGWQEILLVCKNGKVFRFAERDLVAEYKKWDMPLDSLYAGGAHLVDGRGDVPAALSRVARENGIVNIGYEGHEVRAPLFRLLLAAEGVQLTDVGREDTEHFRRIKDEAEIARIVRAQRITEEALEELLPYIRPGAVESELSARLLAGIISRGATGKSCLLLASGSKTGETHARASEKRLEAGDLVQFDIGAVFEGYCSDMSRVVAVERVTDEQRRMYDLVLEAQAAGIAALRPGATGKEVHNAAVQVFAREGLDQYFTHGLGHNVGQLIHEGPYADPESEDVFETGHLCTIEPGLYFPERYGIRVEDMIWLSPSGKVNLTNTTKELRVLK